MQLPQATGLGLELDPAQFVARSYGRRACFARRAAGRSPAGVSFRSRFRVPGGCAEPVPSLVAFVECSSRTGGIEFLQSGSAGALTTTHPRYRTARDARVSGRDQPDLAGLRRPLLAAGYAVVARVLVVFILTVPFGVASDVSERGWALEEGAGSAVREIDGA